MVDGHLVMHLDLGGEGDCTNGESRFAIQYQPVPVYQLL